MSDYEQFPAPRGFRATPALVIAVLIILLLSARSLAARRC